jgi:hypothetical protein
MSEPVSEARLPADELRLLDAYWRAANYVSVASSKPWISKRRPAGV